MDRWERLGTSDGDEVRKWWAATPERRAAFTRAAQERGDRRFDDLTREQWAEWARVGVLPPDVRLGHALPPAGLVDVDADVVAEILGAPAHPVSGDLNRGAGKSGGSMREIRHGAILWRAVRPVTLAEANACRGDVGVGLLPDLALWERVEPAGSLVDVGGWPDRHVVGSYGETRPAGRVDSEGWPGLGNGWLTYDAYDRWLRHLHSAKLARQWVNALCAVVAVMCATLQALVPIDVVDLTAIVGSTSFLFAVYPAVKMFDAYANARAVRGQNYVGPVR